MMSFWTFSDVFEEGGPGPKPFIGQFGLRAEFGINKPSFYAFALLHKLGDQRIAVQSRNVIATKSPDGSLTVAAWNLVDPDPQSQSQGKTPTMKINLTGVPADATVHLERVDTEHGNVLPEYKKLGSPLAPTQEQVDALNRATALPPAEVTHLRNGSLDLMLEPNALVLAHIDAKQPARHR